jgi:prenyltransferase beta subunit
MTAWASLGLVAAGADTGAARDYLAAHESELTKPTELALVALAEAALGRDPAALLARLPAKPTAVNTAIWQILALRQSGRPAPRALVSYLRASQSRNGGFPWVRGTAPDSNDTAAAVQALRAAGVRGTPISRALAYLRKLQTRDGGFRLTAGREPDAQSTALVIQAFVAAGVKPSTAAFAFLAKLRRPDGSYRYSRAYATTPVWVTAQVLPALVKKPFPLR